MGLKGKMALFECGKSTVDIIEAATGRVLQQHELGGNSVLSASIQKNIAAFSILEPYNGVHVMNLTSGKLLCKFKLPDKTYPIVALSKDTLTLGVGIETGME